MLYEDSMDQQSIIASMDLRAKAAGVSMGQVCDVAGIARSTFYRWKKSPDNPEPISATLTSLNKLEAALKAIEAPNVIKVHPDQDHTRVVICSECDMRLDGVKSCPAMAVDCPHAFSHDSAVVDPAGVADGKVASKLRNAA